MKKNEDLYYFLKQSPKRLLNNIVKTDTIINLVLAGIVGLLSGFCAISFRVLIKIFQQAFLGQGTNILFAAKNLSQEKRFLIPVIGAFLAGIVLYIGNEWLDVGKGIDFLEAISVRSNALRLRHSILKSFSSLFSIATGASIGREGPIVQLGSALASKIGQNFKVSSFHLQLMIGCGASAGIAAAYNAPFAGALFAMEILFANFAMEIFGPLIVSSAVATLVSRAYFGTQPIYDIPPFHLVSSFELIPYILLGILSGLIAPTFMKSIELSEKFFKKLSIPSWTKLVLGGICMGCIGLYYPEIWGNGYETVSLMLTEKFLLSTILILFLLKILATSISVGSGAVGGVFTPTLFIGGALGSLIGISIHALFPTITASSGAYTLVGMGALLAATTHAPLMSILIIFEMSLQYSIILPIMMSCVISCYIARSLKPESIYTSVLAKKGIRRDLYNEKYIMKNVQIRDIMKNDQTSIPPNTKLPEVLDLFLHTRHNYLYVTDSKDKFLGAISFHDLKEIIQNISDLTSVIVFDIMNTKFLSISENDTLSSAMEKFCEQDCERLPVVDHTNKSHLLGYVSKRDILEFYQREIMNREFISTRIEDLPNYDTHNNRHLEIPTELSSKVINVPESLDGHQLSNLNVGQRYKFSILIVQRRLGTQSTILIPYPDLVLEQNDLLLVIGQTEDIQLFEKLCKENGFFKPDMNLGEGI